MRKTHVYLSDEEKAQLLLDWINEIRNPRSTSQIAKKYGVTTMTVRNIVKRAGIWENRSESNLKFLASTAARSKGSGLTGSLFPERDKEIVRMHKSGQSFGSIGRIYNLSRTRIYQIFQRETDNSMRRKS